MGMVALILVLVFVLLLVMNVPIAVAIALASFVAILAEGSDAGVVMAANMVNGINSFALLAIPFFILSGHLMGKGGMARRLVDFAGTLVGFLPGGLAYVNTLTCMLFGSISGSAAAAVSSVGGFMIPEMNRKGYNREFNVAVTTTAATTGLLIPPSNIMIVYSVAAGSVSIAAMFMAGVLPGIITGLFIMLVCGWFAFRKKYTREACSSFKEILVGFKRAFLSLFLIVVVIGGILGGIFTATEAAAIAVVYAFILTVWVYREISLKEIPELLLKTGITTAVVMLLVGASSGMSWIMTMANIPQTVSAVLLGLSDNPVVILLTINLLLLIVGTFMDMTPAVLIFTPIFLPVVAALGMHPIHFGIIIIANLCIGLCTPPVGTCLFIGCGVGKTTIAKVTKTMLPFFGAMIAALMVITYVPAVSLWLPVKTRQIKKADVEKSYFMKRNKGVHSKETSVLRSSVVTGCQTSTSIKNIQSSQWMVCANDQLYTEAGGEKRYFKNPGAGSLTIMDVSSLPPQSVMHIEGVPCSLIGPPTCVAVTPDQRVALVVGAMKADPVKPEEMIPNDQLSVVRLMPGPPEVVQKLTLGRQPSGVEISRDGRRALVTNRADGTVSLLSLAQDGRVGLIGTFKVADPQSSVSHAAISPDGNRALITLTKEKSVLFCSLENDRIEVLQKVQGGDGSYGVEFLPDGTGAVAANVYDGTLTVFRISGNEIDVIDTIPAGTVPEGLDISPDGQWMVVNCLDNTNIETGQPARRETGMVLLFQKQKQTFVLMDVIRVDPIPQSAVFTPDGNHVAVGSNAKQNIRFYRVAGHRLLEMDIEINSSGGPAAMRISE